MKRQRQSTLSFGSPVSRLVEASPIQWTVQGGKPVVPPTPGSRLVEASPASDKSGGSAAVVDLVSSEDEEGGAQSGIAQTNNSSADGLSAATSGLGLPQENSVDALQPVAPSAPSALARMMADPGRATRRETFCLGRSPAGEWMWTWEVARKDARDGAYAWERSVVVAYAGRPCSILLRSELPSGPPPAPFKTGYTPSLLKSAIQKSVRRGHAEAACTAALALWRLSPVDLVRRILVIPIEDVCAHPALPVLAWLAMALPKGFVPSDAHLLVALSVVRELCACPWQDTLKDDGGDYDGSPAEAAVIALQLLRQSQGLGKAASDAVGGGESYKAASSSTAPAAPIAAAGHPEMSLCLPLSPDGLDGLNSIHPSASSLVRAILVRAAYGGMTGDVAMLKRAGVRWAKRLASGSGQQWLTAISSLCCCAAAHGGGAEAGLAGAGLPSSQAACIYAPSFLAADLARVPAARSLRLVVTAVEDGCSDLSEAILREGGAAVEEWTALVAARLATQGKAFSASTLLETLQGQVWRCRSGLNARNRAHVVRASAIRDALALRARHHSNARSELFNAASRGLDSVPVTGATTAGYDDANSALSWAELDPARNALVRATLRSEPSCSGAPGGFVPASALRPSCIDAADMSEIREFACIAPLIEAWCVAHLGRRS